jgi:hypothetical protein
MTIRTASRKRVVPCPRCGKPWPIVQAFWEKLPGQQTRLICCCTHCGIEATIVKKKKDPTP